MCCDGVGDGQWPRGTRIVVESPAELLYITATTRALTPDTPQYLRRCFLQDSSAISQSFEKTLYYHVLIKTIPVSVQVAQVELPALTHVGKFQPQAIKLPR